MRDYLEFEKPIADIEAQIDNLKSMSKNDMRIVDEIAKLKARVEKLQHEIYTNLTAFQRVKLARHQKRPGTLQYISMIFDSFNELHGDRVYGDDPAIVTGLASLDGKSLVVVGNQKGSGVRDKQYRNFGMANPEGYRKALRIMKFAERFKKPIVTFIDTPGAYPGIGAEERGQAIAIAENLMELASLAVPIICVIIGEGGSGGALALGVGDHIAILEHSIYSVISPEGCAAILWNDSSKLETAAENLKMTSKDLLELDVVDEIIPEPVGGAHRDPEEMACRIKSSIKNALTIFTSGAESIEQLQERRYAKFRKMGVFQCE